MSIFFVLTGSSRPCQLGNCDDIHSLVKTWEILQDCWICTFVYTVCLRHFCHLLHTKISSLLQQA